MGKNKPAKETTFTMNEVETQRAKDFCNRHRHHTVHMTAGEAFEFTFMPSMIGDVVSVRCLSCGEREDVTDLDKF
ncbi:MAG: hypothetical protein MJZ16_07500 [Bacteroidales bacterium]|nr:hypothetical protein [Bacteroidales bacterium]